MAKLLLVNPRRRKRKMSALQRKYFGNPKRRKKHTHWGAVSSHKRRVNPKRRYHRRHARTINPSIRGFTSSVMPTLKAGGIGATGALGLDLLWGYTSGYLPASIAGSPLAQYAAKLVGAILVGMGGNMLLKGKGRDLAVGATTVVLHDALKAQLKVSVPSLKLGEYLTYAPTVGTMRRAGRLLSTGMSGVGEYLSGLPNSSLQNEIQYQDGYLEASGSENSYYGS